MNPEEQDEYSKAFNDPEADPTEDAPEGEGPDVSAAVKLGNEDAGKIGEGDTSAEQFPEKVPEADSSVQEEDGPTSPEDVQRQKSWEGRLAKREAELKAREEAMAQPQALAAGGEVEPVEVGLGDEAEDAPEADTSGDDIESIKKEAMDLAGDPAKLSQVLATMIADYGREFVVGAVALAGPLIDAKAESYASDFNGNLDGLISEIQGAFSSMHKQTIADAHEDFEALVDSPEFQAYRDALPEDQKAKADATVESGSAGAVIKLLQAFKDAQKAAEAPPEQTPDDVWAEDAATSVRSSAPLKLPTRAPASDEDEYKNAWNDM